MGATKRHPEDSRLSTVRRLASRGSVLILSYFVVAVLLGLAVPQTMRSVSSVQLESRAVNDRQLWMLAEAGVDHGIKILKDKTNEAFGDYYNNNLPSAPIDPGFACSDFNTYWRCWPGPDVGPDGLSGWVRIPRVGWYKIRAADVWNSTGVGKQIVNATFGYRKHLEVTAVSERTRDTVIQDLILDVTRVPWSTNPNGSVLGFEKLVVGSGAKLIGDVEVYGGNSGTNATKFLWIKKNAYVEGKVKVGYNLQNMPADDANLCCGTSDAIRIGPGGAIMSSGKVTVADTNGLNYAAPPEDLPRWRLDSNGNLKPKPGPNPTPIPSTCSATEVLPQGTVRTYYQAGQPVDVDGFIIYCFESLRLYKDSRAQFEGDKVKVLSKGTDATYQNAITAGTNSLIFSFPPGDPSPDPTKPNGHTQLELHVTAGTTRGVRLMGKSQLYGSVFAPHVVVMLGARSETDTTVEDDPPLDGSTEELDPESQVDVTGFVQGREVWLRGKSTLDMRVKQGSNQGGDAVKIKILAWRCRRK